MYHACHLMCLLVPAGHASAALVSKPVECALHAPRCSGNFIAQAMLAQPGALPLLCAGAAVLPLRRLGSDTDAAGNAKRL